MVETIILKDGKAKREAQNRRCRKSGFQHTNRKQSDNSLRPWGSVVLDFLAKVLFV